MRVALADDSALLRQGLVRMLSDAGFDIVGEAGDVEELMQVVETAAPDVVVVDIRMPPTHTDEGITAARDIRSSYPDVAVLVLSQYLETVYAIQLLSGDTAGVGYILKDRVGNIDELADAIRRVAKGESVIDPDVVSRLVAKHRKRDPLAALSQREREVLELMAEGRSNQAIAERLFLSPKTVETYVRNIFRKLNIAETPEDHRRVLAVLSYLRQA